MTDPIKESRTENFLRTVSLLPCPHCGGTDVATIDLSPSRYYCICRDCLARTASASDENQAVKLWNRRAQPRY